MSYFTVITQVKKAAGVQYLCGNDERLAKETASKASARLKRGDKIVIRAVNSQGLATEMACLG